MNIGGTDEIDEVMKWTGDIDEVNIGGTVKVMKSMKWMFVEIVSEVIIR